MIERLINSNLGFLKKYISCDDDTVEIYRYSLRIIYSYIIDVLVLMGLASVTHKVIETVIILFTFAVMQVYGGGYHANTKIGCLSIMVVGWFIGVFALERVVSIHWSIRRLLNSASIAVNMHCPKYSSAVTVEVRTKERLGQSRVPKCEYTGDA